jgi:glycerol kinase
VTTVLAVDQGTTATKAVVIADRGTMLAQASVKVATRALPGGGMEQDPEEIWRSVHSAAAQAIGRAGRSVDVVALATQGESVLAFDPATGAPLSPLITWQDRRAAGICRALADHAGALAEATGLRLSPYFTAPKLAWLRENVTRDGFAATVDAWLLHRLTGQFATDAATASRSLLVDLASGAWNPKLAAVFGLEDEPMPRIVANDEVVGETAAFGAPVPVAGVILDQPAALLAQRCLRAGQVKVTYGTGAFLLANLGARPSAGELICSTAWQLGRERAFCLDGQVFAAATALSWLSGLGLLSRVDALDEECGQGPDEVVFVPSFDEPAGARVAGLALSTRREQLVAAAVYGIAAEVADLYDLAGRSQDVLRVDGGLTGSAFLLQAQADLLQIPVLPYPGAHATAQGAAALARLALERESTLDLQLATGQPESEPVRPAWPPARAEEYRARWREAAGRAQTARAPAAG